MNRKTVRTSAIAASALTLALGLSACGAANEGTGADGADSNLTGTLNAGGASSQEAAVAVSLLLGARVVLLVDERVGQRAVRRVQALLVPVAHAHPGVAGEDGRRVGRACGLLLE